MSTWSAARFVRRLAAAQIGATFNFYAAGAGAEVRRARLAEYLDARRGRPYFSSARRPATAERA